MQITTWPWESGGFGDEPNQDRCVESHGHEARGGGWIVSVGGTHCWVSYETARSHGRKLLEKRVPSIKESCPYDEACGGLFRPALTRSAPVDVKR